MVPSPSEETHVRTHTQTHTHTKQLFSDLPLLLDAGSALLALVLQHKGMKTSNRSSVSGLGGGSWFLPGWEWGWPPARVEGGLRGAGRGPPVQDPALAPSSQKWQLALWSFCILSIICSHCQLFLVLYSFFLFCCSRRRLPRCEHCNKGSGPGLSHMFSPLSLLCLERPPPPGLTSDLSLDEPVFTFQL